MQNKTAIFSLLLLISSQLSFAGDKVFYIGKLFDSEKAKWVNNQVLLVRDDKIIDINPRKIPEKAEIHDWKNFYVIPGLIDSHTHLFLNDPTYSRNFAKGLFQFVTTTSKAERQSLGLARSASMLKSGFTSVRDLGNDGGLQIKGLESEKTPRLFTSGKGFAPKDGQFPAGTSRKILEQEYSPLKGEPLIQKNSDFVKLYADEEPNPAITPPELLKKWVKHAHDKNMKVAVHAIFPLAIDNTIAAGADTLEHGYSITETQLKLMASKKMIFVPSNANFLLKDFPREEGLRGLDEHLDKFCSNISLADKIGVEVAFGSDNYFSLEFKGKSFGEATLECLLHYHACGLSSAKTLQAATFTAAKTLGKEKQVGTLKPGSFADMIVLKKDPLKNINELKTPVKVLKSGNEV